MVSAANQSIAVCRRLIWYLLMLSTFTIPAVHCCQEYGGRSRLETHRASAVATSGFAWNWVRRAGFAMRGQLTQRGFLTPGNHYSFEVQEALGQTLTSRSSPSSVPAMSRARASAPSSRSPCPCALPAWRSTSCCSPPSGPPACHWASVHITCTLDPLAGRLHPSQTGPGDARTPRVCVRCEHPWSRSTGILLLANV